MSLLENLQRLNFTQLEAEIYLALLGSEPMSAYQLAKKIEMSRPAIYNSLEHMLDKGMIELIPNSSSLYMAQDPKVILGKIKSEITINITEAEKGLDNYQKYKYDEMVINFRGYDTFLQKVKEVLKNAKEEVYINTDFNLSCFQEEFKQLKDKNIKVFVFSFYEIHAELLEVEYYSHYRKMEEKHVPSRFMLSVNKTIGMMADGNAVKDSWRGVVSNNKLTIAIISEHIHNDIYLLNLRNKYGKQIYDNTMLIDTEFEKNRRDE